MYFALLFICIVNSLPFPLSLLQENHASLELICQGESRKFTINSGDAGSSVLTL
jgi:hypothetical protein